MADLCAVSPNHVRFLLLLADPYHESAGHQCSGAQRYLFKTGAGEEGTQPSGIKAFQDFVCTFVNAAPNKKLLGYDIAHQWMDVAPPAVLSVVMCAAVIVFGAWLPDMSVWLKLGLQIICGAVVYIVLAAAFRLESFCFLMGMVKEKLRNV